MTLRPTPTPRVRERRHGPAAAAAALLAACALLAGCASPGPATPAGAYTFYPAAPAEPRLQFLRSFSTDLDVLPQASGFQTFVVGEQVEHHIAKPYGVAIHEGQILVCDNVGAGLLVLDLEMQSVQVIGTQREGRLRGPINVAVDADGTRYVTDVALDHVMVYGPENDYLRSIGSPELWKPAGILIADHLLYVSDVKNGQVVVLEKETGEELRRFPDPDEEDEENLLFKPTNLAMDPDGNLYVSDTGNTRVMKYDSEGVLLRQFGSIGLTTGRFVRPKGVAVDVEERLYVVDAATQVVQLFDSEGQLLTYFGGPGSQPGAMYLPAQVVVDYDNVDYFADYVAPGRELEYLVLVTNQYGPNKVSVYGFLKSDGRD